MGEATYGEPWMVVPAGGPQGNWPGIMSQAKGWIIVDRVLSDNMPTGTRNTDRIIACVNACLSLQNVAALPELLAAAETAKRAYELWRAPNVPDGYRYGDVPSVLEAWDAVFAALAATRDEAVGR